MSGRKRALIVGCGGIAAAHVAAYSDPEIAGQAKHGIADIYTDATTAFEQARPELVHVCTPPGTHAALSIAALEAGADVLCEKPLCASLAELDAINEAELRTGRTCATVFQWRYGSGMQHVRRQIESGAFGKPLVGVCNTLWYRDHGYYAVPWRGKWATELGGPTMGHGIHLMDSFLWLMGDWQEVTARVGTLDRDIEVEDVSMAIVRFASGAMATVVNSVLSPRQESYLRIDFQKATVEATGLYAVSNADWRWTAAPNPEDPGATAEARWSTIEREVPASHTEQLRALLGDLAAGATPVTAGTQARRTLSFLTAIYKSAFTGTTVRPDEIVPGDRFYASLNGGKG
jgi:predicted dehydrogenase